MFLSREHCGECEATVPVEQCGTCSANVEDARRRHPMGLVDRSDEWQHVSREPVEVVDYGAMLAEQEAQAVDLLDTIGMDEHQISAEAQAVRNGTHNNRERYEHARERRNARKNVAEQARRRAREEVA